MTPYAVDLLQMIRAVALRLTLNRALRVGARTSAIALAALAAVEAANLIVPIAAVPVAASAVAAAAAGILLTAAVLLLQHVDVFTASRVLDVRMHLDERASTALEIALAATPPAPMGWRVIADATDRVAGIRAADAAPLRLPRELVVAGVLLLTLSAWTAWLHGVTLPGTPARRTAETIRQEGRRLEQFAQSLQSRARAERSIQTRRMAGQMRELATGLQRRIDRAEALARISEVSRQAEAVRQQISERLRSSRPSRAPGAAVPNDLFKRDSLQRQIRQLRELASQLADPQASRQDVLDRLGQITREGEGSQPAEVQRQLQQAREQLERGNQSAASQSLTQALHGLEGLENLLADQEGIRQAQQQLEQSRGVVARGGEPSDQPSAELQSGTEASLPNGGPNRPRETQSPGSAQPPQGPNEGVTPGTGQAPEKLGAPTPRLQAQKTPGRVKGAQGEGDITASEVTGAGRANASRIGRSGTEPSLVRQIDVYMERARIPARYRALVRAYFQRLAQLR